jgi:hypothetical protein
MVVEGGDGVYVCPGHVAAVAWGVHDFVQVTDRELCRMCFEGWKAVPEVNGSAM